MRAALAYMTDWQHVWLSKMEDQPRYRRSIWCLPCTPVQFARDVLPVTAVTEPGGHGAHSGVGFVLFPPADHVPRLHRRQDVPP